MPAIRHSYNPEDYYKPSARSLSTFSLKATQDDCHTWQGEGGKGSFSMKHEIT